MAKKSFKDNNPAYQFLSNPKPPEEREAAAAPADARNDEAMPITAGEAPLELPPHVPSFGAERKSKRLNLLIQPSVAADLAKIAHMQKTSVNDLINRVMKEYCEAEHATLQHYDEVFGS